MNTQNTAPERRARYRQRMTEAGFIQVSGWVPRRDAHRIKSYMKGLSKTFEKEKARQAKEAE